MKKLIVAAVLLLVSIGWFVQRVEPVGRGSAIGAEAQDQVSLGAVEPGAKVVLPGTSPERKALAPQVDRPKPAAHPEVKEASLAVQVKDAKGRPVVGRTILLKTPAWSTAGEPPVLRRTDSTGRAIFGGLSQSQVHVLDGHGGKEEHLRLEPGEAKTLTWILDQDVLVSGRVVDAAGDPVKGADIWSSPSDNPQDPMWIVGQADGGGAFAISLFPAAVIQATAPGLLPSSSRSVRSLAEVSPGVREVTLQLRQPGGGLEGRVIDSLGAPIEGATIAVLPAKWPGEWGMSADSEGATPRPTPAVTGNDGRFESRSDLPQGDHRAVVRAMGFGVMVTTVRIEEGPNAVEWVLHGGFEVSGTVLRPDGTPASKAHVWTALPGSRWQAYGAGEGPSVEADAQGRFTLRRVLPGRTIVRARSGWKGVLAKASLPIDVGDRPIADLEVNLEMGRTILGRTVDEHGYPVPGAVVTAINPSARSSDVASGPDGSFTISALPEPDGDPDEWDLVVRTWTGTSVRVLGRTEGVAPNLEPVDIVVERVGALSATITGRVAAAEGRVPGDVQATLGHHGQSGGTPLAFDPATGAFAKGPLRPGTYRVALTRAGVPVTAKSGLVVGPDETIDAGVILLDHSGSMELRPVLTPASDLGADSLGALAEAATASALGPGGIRVNLQWRDGAWRHRGTLEPGTWHVQVISEDLEISARDVIIGPGPVTAIDLEASIH